MTSTPEWYVLQTKARRETTALANLERQGYRSWLPKQRVTTCRRTRIVPLFPGYLFVRLSPDVDNFAPIRSTFGVLRLVRFGDAYARVPDEMVDELCAHADEHGVCEAVERSLEPGDRVEIIEGAMAGYAAMVARFQGRDRVALLLDVSGRHVALLTSRESIQRV